MTNRSEIQTEDVGRVCPEADMPQWELAQLIRFLKSLSLFPKSLLLKGNSSSGPFPKCPLILKAGLALLYLLAIHPITKYYPRPLIKQSTRPHSENFMRRLNAVSKLGKSVLEI